jgi:hypothetical protein
MEVAARIWDVFLFEGRMYLFRVALAIMKVSEGTVFELLVAKLYQRMF